MDKLLNKLEEIEAKYSSDPNMMPNGNWCHPSNDTEEKRQEITNAVNDYVSRICKQGKDDFLVEQYNRNRALVDHIKSADEISEVQCARDLDNEWHNESI